jgi:spore coat polysaccharide biosynthesis protein SpsF
MRIVTIIQARMGSTRLPGKVMKDLGGETVLARVVRRVQRAALLGEVIVATTTRPADDIILEECRRLSVRVYRGDENDVLDRYYRAAEWANAETVVRITSDCPLIDSEISNEIVRRFLDQQPDYASNGLERTYPRGLDTEVITQPTLTRAWKEACQPYQRVHVTPYIYENPSCFRILSVTADTDYSSHRWTLDTPEDLAFVRAIYERMGNDDSFHWHDVLALLNREPTLMDLNYNVMQKALHEA